MNLTRLFRGRTQRASEAPLAAAGTSEEVVSVWRGSVRSEPERNERTVDVCLGKGPSHRLICAKRRSLFTLAGEQRVGQRDALRRSTAAISPLLFAGVRSTPPKRPSVSCSEICCVLTGVSEGKLYNYTIKTALPPSPPDRCFPAERRRGLAAGCHAPTNYCSVCSLTSHHGNK